MNGSQSFRAGRHVLVLSRRLLIGLGLAVVASFPSAAAVVECSENVLRAAVTDGGSVSLTCGGVYLLSSPLYITRNTTITAAARPVVLSGGRGTRVFHVSPGVELKLIGLTIQDGFSTNGAAINNDGGMVTLVDCVLATNRVAGLVGDNGTNGLAGLAGTMGGPGAPGLQAGGGAIFNAGIMWISNSVFSGNCVVGGDGGFGGRGGDSAEQFDPFGRCRSQGSGGGGTGGNGGKGFGGAILNFGQLVLRETTFAGNTASGGSGGRGGSVGRVPCIPVGPGGNAGNGGSGGRGEGGAIYNLGTLDIGACTLFANEAVGAPGGMGGVGILESAQYDGIPGASGNGVGAAVCNMATGRVFNATMANNVARGGICANAEGGAISNTGSLWVTNCTIWLNRALPGQAASGCDVSPRSVGGAVSTTSNGFTYFVNTIVGAPQVTNSCAGRIWDGSHNLCSDRSAGFYAPGSLNNADPLLGPLAANGGATFTMTLLPGSPALDAGAGNHCIAMDQRGVPRPIGGGCDIGAFEGTGGIVYPAFKQFYSTPMVSYPGPAWLDFWISNTCPATLSNLVLASQLPDKFTAGSGESLISSCSGRAHFYSSNRTVVVSGIFLEPGQSCTVSVPVRPSPLCGPVTNPPASLASPDFFPQVITMPSELLVRRPETSRHAIRLDGLGDLIRAENEDNHALIYHFTLSLWFRTTTKAGGGILGRLDTNSNRADQHIYMDSRGRLAVGVATQEGQGDPAVVSPQAYNDGQWHWVAATFTQPGVKLFVDGELIATNSSAAVPYFLTGAWTIGFLPLNSYTDRAGANFFAGEVDEIQIWNLARGDRELMFDFQQSLCGTEPGLFHYWRAEEGQGTRLLNSGAVVGEAVFHGNPEWAFSGAPVTGSQVIQHMVSAGVKMQSWAAAWSPAILASSTNFLNWQPVATNRAAPDGLITFSETNMASPYRFYRVLPR